MPAKKAAAKPTKKAAAKSKQKPLPKNPVTKAPLKEAKKSNLSIPKTPVKNIAYKIAETGIPKEILEMHLANIMKGDTRSKPKYEIGIRMLFCLADGWNIRESALLCGITERTVCHEWGNPESRFYDETFSKIVSLGLHLSELWWTSVARANLNNKKEFDSTLWMMNMSNRFGWTRKLDGQLIDEWRGVIKEEKEKAVHHISADSIIEAGRILQKIGIEEAIKGAIDVDVEFEE